jgi:hypothetical protein
MGHNHLGHLGPFEACRRCNGFTWDWTDFGILIHDRHGRLVTGPEAIRKLLVP